MAADSKELQSQLAIQQSINKVLADRQKVLEKQQKYLSSQVDTAVQLCKALECKGLDDVQAKMKEVSAGLQSAAKGAGEAGSKIGEMTSALQDTEKENKKVIKTFKDLIDSIKESHVALAGFAAGAAKGFSSAIADIKQMGATIGSVITGIKNIGMSIVAIPFQMFSGLVGMANDLAGSVSALRQGIEDVRGSFGDLASNEGGALMSGLSNLQSQSSSLGGTGVSLAAVYGTGPDGVAAALADLAATAEALGPKFSMLSDEFANSAGEILAFKKGMGLSDEAMSGFATRAISSGESLTDTLQDVGNFSIQMGDKFGVSSKLISKDMGEMAADFKNFGTMSTKEMAAASVYARKLGIDVKGLQGVIGKFDDFEGAADSVSQLNQAFGIQLDTMEMMNAENPAERIDMMKDAFHEAGKSIEDMTRQERALLAEQTGLSEEALATAFSQENMSTSYDDIAAGADEAEEKQLSQTEVMNKLADTMDRVFSSGRDFGGFFDALTQGFTKGLTQFPEFKELLMAIRDALKVVFQAGKEMGKLFGELLGSGGFDILGPLTELFSGDKLKSLFGGIGVDANGKKTGTGLIGAFDKLMSFLKGDDGVKLSDVFDSVSESFKNFFGANSEAANKLKKGISRMITGVGEMIAQMIPWVVTKVVEFFKGIAEAIRNPPDLQGAASEGIGGAIMGAISKIGGALMDAVPDLLMAFLDIIKAVFEKHGGKIIAVGGALLALVLGKMLIFGALAAVKAAVGAVIVKKLTDFLMGAVGGAADEAEAQMPDPKQMEKMAEGVGKGLGSFIDAAADNIDRGKIKDAAINLALVAAAFVPAMVVFALGMVAVSQVMRLASWSGLAKSFVAMLIMMPFLIGIMYAAKEGFKASVIKSAAKNLAFAAVGIGTGLVLFAIALALVDKIIGGIPFSQMVKNFALLGLAILATVAVALVSLFLEPATMTTGMAFLAIAGLVAAVGMVVFAGAIWAVNKILGPIDFEDVVKNFAMLGMAIIATAALALIGLAFAATAPLFIPMIGGLLLAALMLTIGVAVFAGALALLLGALPAIDPKAVDAMFIMIGKALIALGVLAIVGAVFGIITPLMPMMITGLLAAAGFLIVGVVAFAAALLIASAVAGDVIGSTAVIPMIEVMLKVSMAMAILVPLAAIFGMMIPILPFLLWGLGGLAVFMVGAAVAVGAMVAAAASIPIADPEDMAARMEVIGGVATALQALGGLALDAGKLGVAAESLGKGGMDKVFNLMGSFLDKIKDTLVGTVTTLVGLATGYSKSDLEKAAVVGDVVAAVAQFAAAIAEPLQAVSSMIGFFNPSAASVMATVVEGLGAIMDMLAEKLPKIINGLVTAGANIPSGFGEKAEAMKIMFTALGPMMDALGKMQVIAEESVAGIDGPSVSTLFEGMAGGLQALATTMPGVITSLAALPAAEELTANVEKLDQLFASTSAVLDVLGKFTELGEGNAPSLSERAGAAIMGFLGGGDGPTPAAQAILGMVEEMNSINTAMDGLPEINLNANLQKVADAFSVSESINVENKPVNITINLSVTMDANKVGTVLVDKSVMTTPLATAEGQ